MAYKPTKRKTSTSKKRGATGANQARLDAAKDKKMNKTVTSMPTSAPAYNTTTNRPPDSEIKKRPGHQSNFEEKARMMNMAGDYNKLAPEGSAMRDAQKAYSAQKRSEGTASSLNRDSRIATEARKMEQNASTFSNRATDTIKKRNLFGQ